MRTNTAQPPKKKKKKEKEKKEREKKVKAIDSSEFTTTMKRDQFFYCN